MTLLRGAAMPTSDQVRAGDQPQDGSPEIPPTLLARADEVHSRSIELVRASGYEQGRETMATYICLQASPTKESARSRIHQNERVPSKTWRKSAERP
jgi:hypothetical protein